MQFTVVHKGNGVSAVLVDFADEGVPLSGAVDMAGDPARAVFVANAFAADLRRDNAGLFPADADSEPPEEGEELQ